MNKSNAVALTKQIFFGIILILGSIAALAALLILFIWINWTGPRAPLTEAARGSRMTSAEVDAAFDSSVRSRFPIGTPVDELIREISGQGFAAFRTSKDGISSATFSTWSGPCNLNYTVHWAINTTGHLKMISGTTNAICL